MPLHANAISCVSALGKDLKRVDGEVASGDLSTARETLNCAMWERQIHLLSSVIPQIHMGPHLLWAIAELDLRLSRGDQQDSVRYVEKARAYAAQTKLPGGLDWEDF